ncbi:hypothetical protein AVEN_155229-1 [Araneus ventricosus]|uniref:Uncharacterized protein n=1 Tax=Araneus ventricosus TaxID=182803 RepID=A0A4Y2ELT6_ARAVE|nr:hypothetical protein AVEN_155229-1 [Araneus ventricosus]
MKRCINEKRMNAASLQLFLSPLTITQHAFLTEGRKASFPSQECLMYTLYGIALEIFLLNPSGENSQFPKIRRPDEPSVDKRCFPKNEINAYCNPEKADTRFAPMPISVTETLQ